MSGRISSVNTLIKSQGLRNSDFELVSNTSVPNERDIEYKVAIPTEQLNDPKTLKVQFLNKDGVVSATEILIEDVVFEGHSFELRINAEDPFNFMPSPGLVTAYHPPGGMGIRVDSHLFADYRMPPHYDSLAGKIIVHAKDRKAAIQRCLRALAETHIDGIKTNLELHDFILRHEAFQGGDITIHWLEQALEARASS